MLETIYRDEYLLEVFGTTEPTLTQRTEHFFKLWDSWFENRKMLNPGVLSNPFRELNIEQMTEYQVRGNEVRFKNKEDLALAVITCGEAFDV